MSFEQKEYLVNSYLDNYDTEVTSCNLNVENNYEVILKNTIFYPHLSGGQPRDEGTIDSIEVLDVYEKGDDIIHILSKAVEGKVNLKINFDRRFDHMQQHTGQHILSCAFSNLYHAKTIGFHLSGDYTTIDLDVASFDNEMIKKVEEFSNKIIYDNMKIETEILSHDDAIQSGLRKKPVDDETIRIVKIGDKDNVACCGTHTNYTGEIGIVKVVKFEKYKSGTRVEFLCGKRALLDYINKNNDIQSLSNNFSCHTSIVADNILKFKNDNNQLIKKVGMLQDKINEYEAKSMMNESINTDGVNCILKILNDRDIKDLRFIVSNIIENDSYICGIVIDNNESSSIIIGQSSNLNFDIKAIYSKCAQIIEAKGGGNNKIIQGTGKNIDGLNKCFETLQKCFII